jgi:hypothetical protein
MAPPWGAPITAAWWPTSMGATACRPTQSAAALTRWQACGHAQPVSSQPAGPVGPAQRSRCIHATHRRAAAAVKGVADLVLCAAGLRAARQAADLARFAALPITRAAGALQEWRAHTDARAACASSSWQQLPPGRAHRDRPCCMRMRAATRAAAPVSASVQPCSRGSTCCGRQAEVQLLAPPPRSTARCCRCHT